VQITGKGVCAADVGHMLRAGSKQKRRRYLPPVLAGGARLFGRKRGIPRKFLIHVLIRDTKWHPRFDRGSREKDNKL
jgi:hypothetical protein